jgi:SAM-dependent methyltransferase
MFERLKSKWRDWAARAARYPPPVRGDFALLQTLSEFHRRSPERYARFFLRGRPTIALRRERSLFDRFAESGLSTKPSLGLSVPCVRIFPFLGRFVATDLLSRNDEDQVFSLMFEQVYLARNMGVTEGDRVLELCVGSGVNCLAAAEKAREVIAVDLSGRAAAFARFNLALNGRADGAEIRVGSLFEPVAGERFDLVLVNPPFELVPGEASYFLHSHGGEDGLDVVRQILGGAMAHLAPDGRLEMITWSPGDPDHIELVALFEEALAGARIVVDVLGEDSMDDMTAPFRTSPDYAAWRGRLADRGYDRVYFVFVRASLAGPAGVEFREPAEEIAACYEIADSFE